MEEKRNFSEVEEEVSKLGPVKASGMIKGIPAGEASWRTIPLEIEVESGKLLFGKLGPAAEGSAVLVSREKDSIHLAYAPFWFMHYDFTLSPKTDNKVHLKGSLHSHGCWTDYRNPTEQKKFPFDLEAFTRLCLDSGRDFQAITDIMANRPGKPEFIEHRYQALLETASPRADYELVSNSIESAVYFDKGRKRLVIPRTQEVLTNVNFKHILAMAAKRDIRGGRDTETTLKDIQDAGGYAILDHPFMCDAWTEDEILEYYEKGLIKALEWNKGLTLPSFIPLKKIPSRKSNHQVVRLYKERGIPYIVNDDAHSQDDIMRRAPASYNVEISDKPLVLRISEAIDRRDEDIVRREGYNAFFSPFIHVFYGRQSQKMFREHGLPDA